ncbi:F-box/LRR-repeat protein 17-like [Silene latifolia]|uniref:F-box/LRR-repeat protein 17-like n=1 Tax=Silene latifolia TaxID=37657 RepID=UPI003D7819DC
MRHHIATSISPATPHPEPIKRAKKRGSYNCTRCGLPKRGHVCNTATATATGTSIVIANSDVSPVTPPMRRQRSLTFADADVGEVEDSDETDGGDGWMWEVMRRLPPSAVVAASGVCREWREVGFRVWKAVEEIRVRVPKLDSVGFVGSVLKRCRSLVRISLRFESDVDATMLACIAFSCPNLESLEILMSESSVNRITGDELSRFLGDRRCLSNLKMEGCSSIGSLVVSSSCLSTLWLSDLHSLSKTVINCPNLKEVSLNFSRQENDTTDFTSVAENLGRFCPKLQSIHLASTSISHSTVLALSSANLKGLKMLSLVLGSGINDASVAAIAYSFTKLELLDLSGSSISDSGIGIICNVFSRTLTRLLLALCPNVTSSGIQFATAQLPNLELLDCGMSISSPDTDDASVDDTNSHHVYQKLIIKHSRLKKLSLWGCSGLDALHLNCPDLVDLNLTSCRNLHPERIFLQCPNIETVHAANCVDMLQEALETQVNNAPTESHFTSKRMPDSSKRVRIPHMFFQPASDDTKHNQARKRRCIVSTR